MAVLNLGLQHLPLEREQMSKDAESEIRSASSMGRIRKCVSALKEAEGEAAEGEAAEAESDAALTSGSLRGEWAKSVGVPIGHIEERFKRLHFTGNPVVVYEQASEKEVQELIGAIKQIDPSWAESMTNKPSVTKCAELTEFIETHVRHHKYIAEIAVCGSSTCRFGCKEPRMPRGIFDKITDRPRFVPMPKYKGQKKDHFPNFDDIKVREPVKVCCPIEA